MQVLEEAEWYKETLASEEAMLKRFGCLRIWLNSQYVTGKPVVEADKKAKILARLKALLEKAYGVCKEYSEGWLQPHHLLGAVCNEQHRQLVAGMVLVLNGRQEQLQEALTCAVPASGKITAPISMEALLQPRGWVQEELKRRVTEEQPVIRHNLKKWQLAGGNSREQHEQRVREWVYLATTPPQSEGYAFTQLQCPELYDAYISLLFVGFSDNTPLVSTTPHPPHTPEVLL